jgi:hypothetical protein
MRTTIKRLEYLEQARRSLAESAPTSDAPERIRENLRRIGERFRTGGWPPACLPTAEEVKIRLRATLDRLEKCT